MGSRLGNGSGTDMGNKRIGSGKRPFRTMTAIFRISRTTEERKTGTPGQFIAAEYETVTDEQGFLVSRRTSFKNRRRTTWF